MFVDYMSPYTLKDMSDIDIPRSSYKPIVKAEQMCPGTRYAKRQESREKARKWPVKYAEEVDKP